MSKQLPDDVQVVLVTEKRFLDQEIRGGRQYDGWFYSVVVVNPTPALALPTQKHIILVKQTAPVITNDLVFIRPLTDEFLQSLDVVWFEVIDPDEE